MVNHGFSRGCLPCRERRKKCDGAEPACRRCTTAGRICPGYRQSGGFLFRDGLPSRKAEKAGKIDRPPSNGSAVLQRDSTEQISQQHSGVSTAQEQLDLSGVQLVAQLDTSDGEDLVANHFLTHYRRVEVRKGEYEEMLALYSNSHQDSPVRLAFVSLAGQGSALLSNVPGDSAWHFKKYHDAVLATRNMLSGLEDARGALEMVLLVISLLGMTDTIRSVRYGQEIPLQHFRGATGVLKSCSPTANTASNDRLSAFITGLRRMLLVCAYNDGSNEYNTQVAVCLKNIDQKQYWNVIHPVARLDLLDARIYCLRDEMANSTSENSNASVFKWHTRLMALQIELQEWKNNLPVELLPRSAAEVTAPETFDSLEAAHMLNHWRCLNIWTGFLSCRISQLNSSSVQSTTALENQVVTSVNSTVTDILKAAPYLKGTSASRDEEDVLVPASFAGSPGLQMLQYHFLLQNLSSALAYGGRNTTVVIREELLTAVAKEKRLVRAYFDSTLGGSIGVKAG